MAAERGRSSKDGDDDDRSGGPLPFTGFALLTMAAAGAGLVLAGSRLRRSTRRSSREAEPAANHAEPAADPTVAPAAVLTSAAIGGPIQDSAPVRGARSRGVGLAVAAVVGVAGLAVLATHRRA
jgi:hypothetical protein